jgi:SAM-dependent methyltransferase
VWSVLRDFPKTMSSQGRIQLENWFRTINVDCDRVLDVGGSQKPIKGRTKSWNVKDYKILDLVNPHENIQQPDISFDINEAMPMYMYDDTYYFDIVFCGEVSEYLWNPVQALKNINKFMKVGGILYMSFHFISPIHGPEGQDFLRYTKWGVQKLMKETGFEIVELISRVAKEPANIIALYSGEGAKPMTNYKYHNEMGYLVKAIKL